MHQNNINLADLLNRNLCSELSKTGNAVKNKGHVPALIQPPVL